MQSQESLVRKVYAPPNICQQPDWLAGLGWACFFCCPRNNRGHLPSHPFWRASRLAQARSSPTSIHAALVMEIRSGTRRSRTFCLPRNLRLRSEEHTSELQSLTNLVCRLLLENKK